MRCALQEPEGLTGQLLDEDTQRHSLGGALSRRMVAKHRGEGRGGHDLGEASQN